MMGSLPEPINPWGLLCTWPGWRSLRETLHELEQLLRAAGPEAADLALSVGALLADPVSARADLPANYRLHLALKGGRGRAEQFDLESELPGWLAEVARYACDVPLLLAAASPADQLGPALAAELPRALQARFGGLVQSLRQALQGRRVKIGPADELELSYPAKPTARYITPLEDGYALILPVDASLDVVAAAWWELTVALWERWGIDLVRLHLLLAAAWPEPVGRDQVYAALGLRRGDPDRAYQAIRLLQHARLSLYTWRYAEGALSLEHQAQELWSLRLREGGQAHLVLEGSALVTRGYEWEIKPGPFSWIAQLPAVGERARLLLGELEGAKNPLSLALGLLLVRGERAITVEQVLTLAGEPVEAPAWQRLRAAIRLQATAGWQADLGQWDRALGKRLRTEPTPEDWTEFRRLTTTFTEYQAPEEGTPPS